MKQIKPTWFDDYQEWVRYVNRYMMNAQQADGVFGVVVKDDGGRTIASWPKGGGSGVVYEQRSPERLESDINKLK